MDKCTRPPARPYRELHEALRLEAGERRVRPDNLLARDEGSQLYVLARALDTHGGARRQAEAVDPGIGGDARAAEEGERAPELRVQGGAGRGGGGGGLGLGVDYADLGGRRAAGGRCGRCGRRGEGLRVRGEAADREREGGTLAAGCGSTLAPAAATLPVCPPAAR